MTTSTIPVPQAWCGCESCYAAGRLVGQWFDITDVAEVGAEQIHAGSGVDWRRAGCEEFIAMDVSGLPTDGEPSLPEVVRWAEVWDELDSPEQWPALCAWVRSGSYVAQGDTDLPCVGDFEEAYCGEWDSFADYAYQLADDIDLFDGLPEDHVAARYFGWAGWISDLEADYTVERAQGGGVYVFRAL